MPDWNHKNYREFIQYVKGEYGEYEENIARMVDYEIDRLIEYWRNKKRLTTKFKRELIDDALANCRRWLSESLEKPLTPALISDTAKSKLYFNMLTKK